MLLVSCHPENCPTPLCRLCPSPPSGFFSPLLLIHHSYFLLGKRLLVMRNTKKHIITLCLFEFLSSCCHSNSCYIDWCPYEPGYCLTSPPTFAQIRKINKITAATLALPCTNNTLLTTAACAKLHILHLAVRGNVDFEHMLERRQRTTWSM